MYSTFDHNDTSCIFFVVDLYPSMMKMLRWLVAVVLLGPTLSNGVTPARWNRRGASLILIMPTPIKMVNLRILRRHETGILAIQRRQRSSQIRQHLYHGMLLKHR